MQNTSTPDENVSPDDGRAAARRPLGDRRSAATGRAAAYRERLAPSLWLLGSAGVVAPMAALVFVQIDSTLALAIGIAVAVLVVATMIGLAPVIATDGTTLRAGRAHIDVSLLGEPVVLEGEEARAARGRDLDTHGWHLIRGSIDGVVVIPVTDQDDPTTTWTLSTRTPERLAATIRHLQAR